MSNPAPTPETPFKAPAALARLKKRKAADRRFKLYGQMAIGVAISMLALLLVSITSLSFSAFSKHSIVFDTVLTESIVAPTGTADRAAIETNVSGFYQLMRDDLAATFPESNDSRELRGELGGMLTRLAVQPVAKSVAAHPQWIGAQHRFRLVLSDDLDLYLKGRVSPETRVKIGKVASLNAAASNTKLAEAMTEAWADLPVDARGTVLLQAGASVAKLTAVSPAPAYEMLTGSEAAFTDNPVTARLIALPEAERNVTDHQIAWALALKANGRIKNRLNTELFTNADSTYPELAGVLAALVGSLLTMMVTALVAIPVGIGAAVYLEEFAPKNRVTKLIELNINNLAAVPSIVFGLLGAAVFIVGIKVPMPGWVPFVGETLTIGGGLGRGWPLVGGLVLALLTLPTIIIASRAALQSVPPSIRSGALGVGASKTQSVFHHVLPLAAPGIMTGSIIGMARALGETAPLLLIGMVAFIAKVPGGPTDEATVLPVLIYKWSTGAERAWEPLTAAAIIVLLLFMVFMNGLAVILRRRFERRW